MGQYLVMTTYWKHAKYTDFCRMTTVINNHDGSVANYALAQYYFTGEPHKVSPKKNRCNKPFHPTTPSTFQFIKENARRPLGPGTVFDRAFKLFVMFPGIFSKLRMPDRDWGWRSRMTSFKISCRVLSRMMMWRVCSGPLLQESCLLAKMEEIVTNCCGPNATDVFSTSLPPVIKIECSSTTRLEESLTFQGQQCFM